MKKIAVALLLFFSITTASSIAKKSPELIQDIETLAAEGSQEPGKATLFVLRGRSKAGVMMKHNIIVDGSLIGSIRRMNYLAIPLEPGRHNLVIDCPSICSLPSIDISADFEADRTYYFLNDPDFAASGRFSQFSATLYQLDKSNAEIEMRGYLPGRREGE